MSTVLENVCHNTDPDRAGETWAQRVAFSQSISQPQLRAVRRICYDRISDFTQAIDDSFMGYEILGEDSDPGGDRKTVAVGVFYFEEKEGTPDLDW